MCIYSRLINYFHCFVSSLPDRPLYLTSQIKNALAFYCTSEQVYLNVSPNLCRINFCQKHLHFFLKFKLQCKNVILHFVSLLWEVLKVAVKLTLPCTLALHKTRRIIVINIISGLLL